MKKFDWETMKLPKREKKAISKYLYVLELQDDKYYVGTTANPRRRFKTHSTGNSSPFVKKYLPIKKYELTCLNTLDLKRTIKEETLATVRLIKVHGLENVYGGTLIGNLKDRKIQYKTKYLKQNRTFEEMTEHQNFKESIFWFSNDMIGIDDLAITVKPTGNYPYVFT